MANTAPDYNTLRSLTTIFNQYFMSMLCLTTKTDEDEKFFERQYCLFKTCCTVHVSVISNPRQLFTVVEQEASLEKFYSNQILYSTKFYFDKKKQTKDKFVYMALTNYLIN